MTMVRPRRIETVLVFHDDEEAVLDLDALLRACGVETVLAVDDAKGLAAVMAATPVDLAVVVRTGDGAGVHAASLRAANVAVVSIALDDGARRIETMRAALAEVGLTP